LSLGVNAYEEYITGRIGSFRMDKESVKFQIPPFRLLLNILCYFYFHQNRVFSQERYDFISQFAQLLLASLYKSHVVFMNYDVVYHGGDVWIVTSDGLKDNPGEFQTRVECVNVKTKDKQIIATNELDLVTSTNLVEKYKFQLFKCKYVQDITSSIDIDQFLRDAKENQPIGFDERISIAVIYYRNALALSDILMSSIANVRAWFKVDTSRGVYTGKSKRVNLGGGQKRPFDDIALQGGAFDWFGDKASGLWNSFKNMISGTNYDQGIQIIKQLRDDDRSDSHEFLNVPDIYTQLRVVSQRDNDLFGNITHNGFKPFVIDALYEGQDMIGKILDVGLAGATLKLQEVVEEWIDAKHLSDESTKFELLWRVPSRSMHVDVAKHPNVLYDIIHDNNAKLDDFAIYDKTLLLGKNLEHIMDVFSASLKKISAFTKLDRGSMSVMSSILRKFARRSPGDRDNARKLVDEHRENLQRNLNQFINHGVTMMIAKIDPKDFKKRTHYIMDVAQTIVALVIPRSSQNLIEFADRFVKFPVQNYEANDFLRVRGVDQMDEFKLDAFTSNPPPNTMPHGSFSSALDVMKTLDVYVEPPSEFQKISSYSFVTMFLSLMDKVIAKFGSVVYTGENQPNIIHTNVSDDYVSIEVSDLPYNDFKKSLYSTILFSHRDMFALVKDMNDNKRKYQIRETPYLSDWTRMLEDENIIMKYGTFEMDGKAYRPCIRKYRDVFYYCCAWNFPIRILPVNETNIPSSMHKIGTYECNMYAIAGNASFGITPTAFQEAKAMEKDLLAREISTNDQRLLHQRTSYSMLVSEPLCYHLDIMPLFRPVAKRLIAAQTGGADGANRAIDKAFRSVTSMFASRDHDRFSAHNIDMIRNVIYTLFYGCYYMRTGNVDVRDIIKGGADSVDARQLAQQRDSSNTKPRGELYKTHDLKSFGQAYSPLVYSVFYYLNGLMGISGKYSPYILQWYQTMTIPNREGRRKFAEEFLRRKDMAKGFTINAKLQQLGLRLPSDQDASKDARDSKATEPNTSSSSGLPKATVTLLSAAGLLGLYDYLTKCSKDSKASRDERTKCERGKEAIDQGLKNNFKAGRLGPYGWEKTMKQFPGWFAKKDGKWTDVEDVDPRYSRFGRDQRRRRDDRDNSYSRNKSDRYRNDRRGMSYSDRRRDPYRNRRDGRRDGRDGRDGRRDGRRDDRRAYDRSRSDVRDREDMLDDRERYKLQEEKERKGGAANIELKDVQGRTVFRMLPHNIVANVLLMLFAGLTAWASSSGTSTYTRLLDVEEKKGSKKLADLIPLQKSRMACTFFFGMGIGIFVAFLVSIVEMADHKRVRQGLFLLLMSLPIIILGIIGITGANNTCSLNPGDVCEDNTCGDDGKCSLDNTQTCSKDSDCTTNTCQGGKCSVDNATCSGDVQPTLSDQSDEEPSKKRTRYVPKKKSSFPKLQKFWKSLMGLHDDDILKGDSDDNSDDVLRFNVMASDYLFMGLGAGVLVAGICTILPDNPFHPNQAVSDFQTAEATGFSTVSQINPGWWGYAMLFCLVLAGAGTSSLVLCTTNVPTTTDNQHRDVRQSGLIQSGTSIGLAVVLFIVIFVMGKAHIKRHTKKGRLMSDSRSSRRNDYSGAGLAN
jgi:hypothetical protein